jgi:hypothetical protein
MPRPNVFISYSHQDQRILRGLLPFLESLQRQNYAEIWSDTDLKGGDRWREEIEVALNSATVAVLLISESFLTSRFIYEEELPRILLRHSEGKLTVLPVYLSPSTVTSASISFIDKDGIKRGVLLSVFQGFGTPDRTIEELAPTQRRRRFLKLHDRIKELAASAPTMAPASTASPVQTKSLPVPKKLYAVGQPNMDRKVVREIQRALLAAGFDPGTIDGLYGAHTRAAVAAFQKVNGLAVDGQLGFQTAKALGIKL